MPPESERRICKGCTGCITEGRGGEERTPLRGSSASAGASEVTPDMSMDSSGGSSKEDAEAGAPLETAGAACEGSCFCRQSSQVPIA